MKLTFYSNYLNHHQIPLSNALYRLLGDNYVFVATTPIYQTRLSLGYEDVNKRYPYVLTTYDNPQNYQLAKELAADSDVIITGSAPEEYSRIRIKANKLMFRYSERPLKNGLEPIKYPYRYAMWHLRNPASAPIYMLCSSAYTSGDYAKFGLFFDRTYKWGYFPEVKRYDDIGAMITRKKSASILWAGRLIEWKHPDAAILVAANLHRAGYDFELNIIGSGTMEQQLQNLIISKGLEHHVHMLGSMSPEKVREHMEKSEIFLFTSDRKEGWGAVLNESMNSGCAVVGSHAIGSVPFLLKDGENGLIYRDGDVDALYTKVRWLLDNADARKRIGEAAYKTMTTQWNAENAASRFLRIAQAASNGEQISKTFEDGVCSPAEILRDNWFRG